MTPRLNRVVQVLCASLAAVLLTAALVQQASAAGTCDRTVTRSWHYPPGEWWYTDGGCAGDCPTPPQGNTCYDHFPIGLGNQPHYCTCTAGAPLPCTKVVYRPIGDDPPPAPWTPAPNCLQTGCVNDCLPIWEPHFGDPQTLTCPCP